MPILILTADLRPADPAISIVALSGGNLPGRCDQIALIFQVIPLLIGSIGLGFLIRLFFAAPKSDTIAAPQRDDAMGQQQTTVDFALCLCGPIPEFSCADLREQS
jgi:hypothetical protein